MARYTVPQDVEAEDKLIGPFSFRQFVYLIIAAIGIGGCWALFSVFPPLAIIPFRSLFYLVSWHCHLKKSSLWRSTLGLLFNFT